MKVPEIAQPLNQRDSAGSLAFLETRKLFESLYDLKASAHYSPLVNAKIVVDSENTIETSDSKVNLLYQSDKRNTN